MCPPPPPGENNSFSGGWSGGHVVPYHNSGTPPWPSFRLRYGLQSANSQDSWCNDPQWVGLETKTTNGRTSASEQQTHLVMYRNTVTVLMWTPRMRMICKRLTKLFSSTTQRPPHALAARAVSGKRHQIQLHLPLRIIQNPEQVYYHPYHSSTPMASKENSQIAEATRLKLAESNKQLL